MVGKTTKAAHSTAEAEPSPLVLVHVSAVSARQPKLAILDETDSGLDIDALKTVAAGVNSYR